MKETKESEVKIDKMTLNIDGEKVNLTIEQAKKLKKVLDELFGKEIIKEVVKEVEHHHYRDWYWNQPYVSLQESSGGTKYLPDVVYCADMKTLNVNF